MKNKELIINELADCGNLKYLIIAKYIIQKQLDYRDEFAHYNAITYDDQKNGAYKSLCELVDGYQTSLNFYTKDEIKGLIKHDEKTSRNIGLRIKKFLKQQKFRRITKGSTFLPKEFSYVIIIFDDNELYSIHRLKDISMKYDFGPNKSIYMFPNQKEED